MGCQGPDPSAGWARDRNRERVRGPESRSAGPDLGQSWASPGPKPKPDRDRGPESREPEPCQTKAAPQNRLGQGPDRKAGPTGSPARTREPEGGPGRTFGRPDRGGRGQSAALILSAASGVTHSVHIASFSRRNCRAPSSPCAWFSVIQAISAFTVAFVQLRLER